MNPPALLILAAFVLAPLAGADGKPPSPAKPDARPSPSPSAANEGSASLLPWLLLQNGGPAAASVPWPEIVRAAGGKQVSPLDPTNPSDAATLTRLGAALDAVLPRLNRPDGTRRVAPALTTSEAAARIADELRAALAAAPGNAAVESVAAPDALCPVLRWSGSQGSRTCYLLVTVYPAGGKEAALRSLTVRAADLAGQVTTDGTCILVGVEHNRKSGRDLALLNWEAIDLARVSLRCDVTFEADANTLHVPGAALGDGRRGRD